jgi:5,6,7,8-tetrahydromethanopterin hydro-lyase
MRECESKIYGNENIIATYCYYDNIGDIYRLLRVQIYRKKTNIIMMQAFEGVLVGEALVGEGSEIAHIDLVIGPRGSTVEQAFVNALASPSMGHTPLLAVLEPNLPAKPHTLMVNKVTIKDAAQAVLIFGPAQMAVAKAVMDCVSVGVLPEELAEDLFIIVSVFIEWDAKDKKKVYEYNYQATKLAIERAVAKEPKPVEILAKRDSAKHPFA